MLSNFVICTLKVLSIVKLHCKTNQIDCMVMWLQHCFHPHKVICNIQTIFGRLFLRHCFVTKMNLRNPQQNHRLHSSTKHVLNKDTAQCRIYWPKLAIIVSAVYIFLNSHIIFLYFTATYRNRSQPIRYPGELQLSKEPFESVTTNKGDFSPRREIESIKRRSPIKSLGELTIDKEPFANATTNRNDFR